MVLDMMGLPAAARDFVDMLGDQTWIPGAVWELSSTDCLHRNALYISDGLCRITGHSREKISCGALWADHASEVSSLANENRLLVRQRTVHGLYWATPPEGRQLVFYWLRGYRAVGGRAIAIGMDLPIGRDFGVPDGFDIARVKRKLLQ